MAQGGIFDTLPFGMALAYYINSYHCLRCDGFHPQNVVCLHPLPEREIKIERCEVCGCWHSELYQHPPTPLPTDDMLWIEDD